MPGFGLFPYINPTATEFSFVVDGTDVYEITASTVLKNADGTIAAMGTAVKAALTVGDQLKIEGNTITRIKTADELATAAADAFKDAHEATLELTVATVAVTDEAAVDNAIAAYNALSAAAKAKLTAENTLLGNLKAQINTLKAAAADQSMVEAELAKVDDVELAAGTDLTADQSALVKAEVEKSVDLNKVTVTVTKGADDNTYNVKLDSKAAAGTDNKNIAVTVAL